MRKCYVTHSAVSRTSVAETVSALCQAITGLDTTGQIMPSTTTAQILSSKN